jgi:diaminopimelate decarboxylase
MALDAGIGQFNLELEEEGFVLARVGGGVCGKTASAVLRVNPDVDAGTHAKISTGKSENKFGVPISDAMGIFARLSGLPGLGCAASHCISAASSSISSLRLKQPMRGSARSGRRSCARRGMSSTGWILAAGLGVPYERDKVPPSPGRLRRRWSSASRKGWDVTLMFEPGRVIVGNAGVLLTRVMLGQARCSMRSLMSLSMRR